MDRALCRVSYLQESAPSACRRSQAKPCPPSAPPSGDHRRTRPVVRHAADDLFAVDPQLNADEAISRVVWSPWSAANREPKMAVCAVSGEQRHEKDRLIFATAMRLSRDDRMNLAASAAAR